MRKWLLALVVLSMLVVPMLACGFPLPAGNVMMAVSKAVCAEGEAAESCQVRQDAYQLMSTLESASVQDMELVFFVNDGESETAIAITGWYDYMVDAEAAGIGAYVHGTFETAEMTEATGAESLSGMEFVIAGDRAYSKKEGEEWVVEELSADALAGIGLLLGLSGPEGASFDLFTDPAIFTVTPGMGAEMMGQGMTVQTLAMDLSKLLGSTDALNSLMQGGLEAGGDTLGMSEEDLGFTPEDLAMMSMFLMPTLTGTEFSTTLYIGNDDGYIHRVEDKFIFLMDLSAMGLAEEGQPSSIEMRYELSGDITGHNQPIDQFIPEDAAEGEGLFGEESSLFGGDSGLGDSLFGG